MGYAANICILLTITQQGLVLILPFRNLGASIGDHLGNTIIVEINVRVYVQEK